MSSYAQNPPPQDHYPPAQVSGSATGYVNPTPLPAPPVVVDQPVKDGYEPSDKKPSHETQSRGEGFWRGCCAGMCCCCLLDICF